MPVTANGESLEDSKSRRRKPVVVNNKSNEDGGDASDGEENAEASNDSSGDDDYLSEEPVARRRSTRTKTQERKQVAKPGKSAPSGRRTSSRATKFTSSMAEPTDAAFLTKRAPRDTMEDDSEEDSPPPKKRNARGSRGAVKDSLATFGSPQKSPARRHAKARHSIHKQSDDGDDDDVLSDSQSSSESEEDESDDQEPLKIHRILASRTETLSTWREICKTMQTSEVESGSRWFQEEGSGSDDGDVFEERFLVKWKDLSHLHCSWETQADLESFTEGQAKTYLSTFFRKMENGVLLSADERCDGDYFDPGWTQIDRILEIELPEGDFPALTLENESKTTPSDYGIILDRSHEKFDEGTGRQFLIKWCNMPYSEGSWEFERDLVMSDFDYKDDVRAFIRRNTKPTKSSMKELLKEGEKERRRLYKIFGEKSTIDETTKETAVNEYKQELQGQAFKNDGQLRDYQAEGVAWMMSNYVNSRSCILADEMGLGKTLQTVATVNTVANALHAVGPALVIAPLSTLTHWQREFQSWTNLNTIVYHGTSEDRKLIREHEFAYQLDRPDRHVGINQLYLKKCGQKKPTRVDNPWMVDVVITTPEIMIADDSVELTAVEWEVLVVDEAHRLKNHSSKFAVKLRDAKLKFGFKLLLTGTPIQNDVQEFWTLLNFIDPDGFGDPDEFYEKYGDMKSKDRIDELHEQIRPYILRRLKEDVEKSVPPKEETLIEVELTVMQKQYYRALFEKNVAFLQKTKKRAIDGPSLNNLAMQLRKCCNHVFLLNGVEDDIRKEDAHYNLSEADMLVKGSGKLVLLDKLLPRLKEQGHRILLFSQFKIMLDVLEDYFRERKMNFERIDGSITGHRRQQAIDRFQKPPVEGREAPFIMMLSTRAGGVGITLTAADTVIIFDSDWNPQNDLQAQARCHRIGQTKNVVVYRLLTRKTYEMQMFHMASLKMGLDQAVLNGFEVGSSSEGLSKDEVEKLLRNGAYEIFKEDKEGKAEEESNQFIQQDIDSILQRRSRTVIHEGTGSKSHSAAGSTFSKASFKVAKSPSAQEKSNEDVDVDDPDFWKKLLGEPTTTDAPDELGRRERTKASYAENTFTKDVDGALFESDSEADAGTDDDDDDDEGNDDMERARWGGSAVKNEWRKDAAEGLAKHLSTFGYDDRVCERFRSSEAGKSYDIQEVTRMMWSIVFVILHDTVEDVISRRRKREMEGGKKDEGADGGMLAKSEVVLSAEQEAQIVSESFQEVWRDNASWIRKPLEDACSYARSKQARDIDIIDRTLRPETWKPRAETDSAVTTSFAQTWQSLKNRGWKATLLTEGDKAGKTKYEYEDKHYWTQEAVVEAARELHPGLEQACNRIIELHKSHRRRSHEQVTQDREQDLSLTEENVSDAKLQSFLERYGCLQLLLDRKKSTRISLPRRIFKNCSYMEKASKLVREAQGEPSGTVSQEILVSSLAVDWRSKRPHPLWNSRHDALLIQAIASHGWIEKESSCRAIASDTTIQWGAPFDPMASEITPPPKAASENISDVTATALRVANFINSNKELLEDFKGVNIDELKRLFCLVREHNSEVDNTLDFDSHIPWTVDEVALVASTRVTTADANPDNSQDLPPPKDLIARAKLLLTKCNSKHSPVEARANAITKDDNEQKKYPFTVLDQSVRCNTFLAELLRGVMKTSAQKLANKKKLLCALAREEAVKRLDCIQLVLAEKSDKRVEPEKARSDMKNIISHIDLVKRHLSSTKPRLHKNVLRVILGEEPAPGRNGEEGLFPTDTTAAPSAVLQTFATATADNRSSGNMKTTGDRALDAASRRAFVSKRGQANGEPSSLLDLTEVEALILRVACNLGLPVWRSEWESQLSEQAAGWTETYNVSWIDFSNALVQLAIDVLQQEEGKLLRVQQEAGRIQGNTEQVLWNAQRQYNLKKSACSQSGDYSKEPETLAKKTIMMLTRVMRYALKNTSTATAKGESTSDATTVLQWLETEILRWSRSLDLLDTCGHPLGFTAADFLEDLAEEERSVIEIASCVDTKGGQHILQQIALMSRIRNIFLTTDRSELSTRIPMASQSVASQKWELEPKWWKADDYGQRQDAEHDTLLLERLVRNGFFTVTQDRNDYGRSEVTAAQVTFQELGLGTRAIEMRASQLAKPLHELDEKAVDTSMDDSSVEIVSPGRVVKRRSTGDADTPSTDKKMRAS